MKTFHQYPREVSSCLPQNFSGFTPLAQRDRSLSHEAVVRPTLSITIPRRFGLINTHPRVRGKVGTFSDNGFGRVHLSEVSFS